MGTSSWKKVLGSAMSPKEDGERYHTLLQPQGRYISIIRHKGHLHCLDSACYHAGGPLALGDIEEVDSRPVLVCPWHYSRVELETGAKLFQEVIRNEKGAMVPGEWKSVGQRQRIHAVEEREDGVYVQLSSEGQQASDEYACKPECGERIVHGHGAGRHIPGYLASGDTDSVLCVQPPGHTLHGPPATHPESPAPGSQPNLLAGGEGQDCWPADLPQTASRSRSKSLGKPLPEAG